MSRTKEGSTLRYTWPWSTHATPLSVIITEGTRADCKQACALIDELNAESLLLDRGYDANEIIEAPVKAGMEPVIPSKKNRKVPCNYDKGVYKIRHVVENAFLHLKR